MFFNSLKPLLLGAVFLCPLTFADQYPDAAKSIYSTVTVQVSWLPTFAAVNALCAHLSHIPIPKPEEGAIVGCFDPTTHTIYVVEPTSFNDFPHLEILGHEFWHALGADHPEHPAK